MDLDIYSDLDILDNQFGKIEQENEQLKESVNKLEVIAKNFVTEIKELKKINKNLEVNISSLYKTAKAEIERKDRLISELRKELDTVLFKRGVKIKKNISEGVNLQENELLNKQYAEAQSALEQKNKIIVSLNKELDSVRKELCNKSSSSKRTFSHIDKDSEPNYSDAKKQKIHEKDKIVEHEDEYNNYCNRSKRDSYIRSRSKSPNFRKFDAKRRNNVESQVELKRINYRRSRSRSRERFRPNNKYKYNRYKYVKNSYKDRYENVRFSKSHSKSPAWNYKYGEKDSVEGPESPSCFNKNNEKYIVQEKHGDSGIHNSQSTENTGRRENLNNPHMDSLSSVSDKNDELEDGELDSTKFDDIDFNLSDDKESIISIKEMNQSKETELCTKNKSKLTDSGIKTEFIDDKSIKTEDDIKIKNNDTSNVSQEQSLKQDIIKRVFPKIKTGEVKIEKTETDDKKLNISEKNTNREKPNKIMTDKKLTMAENLESVEQSNILLKNEEVTTLDNKNSEKPVMEKEKSKSKNDKTNTTEKKSTKSDNSNKSIKNKKHEIVDKKIPFLEKSEVEKKDKLLKNNKVETVSDFTEKSPDIKNKNQFLKNSDNDIAIESNSNKQNSNKNDTNISFVIDSVCKEKEIKKTIVEPETNISFVSESPKIKKAKHVHTVSDYSDTNVTLVTETKIAVNKNEITKTAIFESENVELKRSKHENKDNTKDKISKESSNLKRKLVNVEKSKDIPVFTTEPSTSSSVPNINLNKGPETSVASEDTVNLPPKTKENGTTDKQSLENNLQQTAKKPVRLRRRCVISIT